MDNEVTFGPREVAGLLGVSSSTLRMYAARFHLLLSDRARGGVVETGSGFAHRRYGADDVQLLRRAKDLLDAGLSYEATLGQLGHGTVLSRPISPAARPRRRAQRSPIVVDGPSGAGGSQPTDQDSIPAEVSFGNSPTHSGGVIDEATSGSDLTVAQRTSGRSTRFDEDEMASRLSSVEDALAAVVRQTVQDALAPLRAEVALLAERFAVVAERGAEQQRALDELRRQAAWTRQCLEEALRAMDAAPVQAGWLGRVLRRG